MGSTDKIIRILLAVVFGVLYFTGTLSGTLGLILLIVGVIFLLTAVVNFCPIYAALGLRSNKKSA